MSEVEGRAVSRAVRAPMTVDEQARTVEVVFSAGTRAPNHIPGLGMVLEELDMSPNAVRMATFASGDAPVLDSHARGSARAVLGRVIASRIEGGRGYATLRMSDAADVEPIWRRIVDGSLRHVSVGYEVRKYDPVRSASGEMVYRAVDWQPKEVSFCAIPVDPMAAIRSEGGDAPQASAIEIIPDEVPADASVLTRAADVPMARSVSGDNHPVEEAQMAESPNTAPEIPAVVPPAVVLPVNEDAVRSAERTRIVSLREAGEAAGSILERAAIAEVESVAVSEGWSAERFRAALLDKAVAGGQTVVAPTLKPVAQMGHSNDDPAVIVDAMATAIAVRSMPQQFGGQAEGKWREYMALDRPSDMLMELAAARGERISPRQRGMLIGRAFHTTSDFPMLLESAGNKMLQAGYTAQPQTFKMFFAQKSFNDFKPHKFLTPGSFPALQKLEEGGEITAGTITEKRESVSAATYARQFRLTRQMLVNDDLGAFTDFGSMIGASVADDETGLAYDLLNTASGDGPTLTEGATTVFSTAAGRLNKAAAASTVTAKDLGLGFNAMAVQTAVGGRKRNYRPRYLVASPIQEFVAAQFATSIASPSAAGNVNVFAGRYTVISDANVPANRWYLFADPAVAPVYVYGYVGGQTGPMIRTHQYVPGTDGIAVEVVHDFAVGAIDYRGAYFNSGVAPT